MSVGSPESLEGIEDGLVTVMPAKFFNASVLDRLSATGLLGGVLVLEEDRTAVAETVVGSGGDHDGGGGGDPEVSLPISAGVSSGVGGTISNPDVKTPQVRASRRVSVLSLSSLQCKMHGRVYSGVGNVHVVSRLLT